MQDQGRHPPPPKHSDRVLLHNTDTTVNNWFDPAIGFVNQTDNIQPAPFHLPVVLRKLYILQSFLPYLLHKIIIDLHQSHGLHKQCRNRPNLKTPFNWRYFSSPTSRFIILAFCLDWCCHKDEPGSMFSLLHIALVFIITISTIRKGKATDSLNSSRSLSHGNIGRQNLNTKDKFWASIYNVDTYKCRRMSWNFRILSSFQLRLDEVENFLSTDLEE